MSTKRTLSSGSTASSSGHKARTHRGHAEQQQQQHHHQHHQHHQYEHQQHYDGSGIELTSDMPDLSSLTAAASSDTEILDCLWEHCTVSLPANTLVKHVQVHLEAEGGPHAQDGMRMFRCRWNACKRQFDRLAHLESHVPTHHRQPTVFCPTCQPHYFLRDQDHRKHRISGCDPTRVMRPRLIAHRSTRPNHPSSSSSGGGGSSASSHHIHISGHRYHDVANVQQQHLGMHHHPYARRSVSPPMGMSAPASSTLIGSAIIRPTPIYFKPFGSPVLHDDDDDNNQDGDHDSDDGHGHGHGHSHRHGHNHGIHGHYDNTYHFNNMGQDTGHASDADEPDSPQSSSVIDVTPSTPPHKRLRDDSRKQEQQLAAYVLCMLNSSAMNNMPKHPVLINGSL